MDSQYDRIADEYDSLFFALPYRPSIEAPSVLRLVGDVRGLSVLDLACGTGVYSRKLRQLGAARVVGVDISEGQIAQAQAIEEEHPLGITYLQGSAADLPLDEQFDLVVAVYLLHYADSLDQLRAMCQEIADHLKPGSRFVTYQLSPDLSRETDYYAHYGLLLNAKPEQETLADGEPLTFRVRVGDFTSDELTVYYYSTAALTQALEQAGLSDIRISQPEIIPEAVATYGAEHWQNYLTMPHCILIEATKA
ncbi:MAG TPA: class I SAM-dependent methyltransferase [Herpetosiphonaceae bacterium]